MVQSINLSGIASAARLFRHPSLVVPHISVSDIRNVNFKALKAAGIEAIVFDKDNTVTAPYVDTVHPPFERAWVGCKNVFGTNRMLIVSNSAGTPDDAEYKKAERVEQALGVSVLRHELKKPAGGALVASHFSCRSPAIAVVGDRALTDVVYGNSNGMLTIFVTDIVTEKGDNVFAAAIRRLEYPLVRWLQKQGFQPPPHPALCSPMAKEFIQQP